MASTRGTLAKLTPNLDESMGRRDAEVQPMLSPVASLKDEGRRPLRKVGTVEINRVVPDPDQPRAEFAEDAIERLAQSIREKGQLLPIHVRWSEAAKKWIIISGERRWRATLQAGLPTIDCYFQEKPLNPSEILEQQLVENLLREDLKPIEQARAFAGLMKLNGWNGKQVAEALRVQPSTVSRALALLRLPDDIQKQVDAGEIPARSAYELSKVKDDRARSRLAAETAAGRLSHHQAAKVARQRRGKPARKATGIRLTFPTEHGFRITVTANRTGTYHDVEAALLEVVEEVRQRLRNNVQLF
ncbi:MAG: ParB/RepB/Spo0J family partition protein [Phycisphaerae bacterium]|nr:ParB/RepB/Spo0J family partition protein [Phycisphaerae bacterium]